ncbi:MAG: hypothetical protein WCI20_04770 [bacterium]
MSNGVKNPAFDTPVNQAECHSAFVPLLLILISFIMILGWTLTVSVRQATNLQTAKFQVWQAAEQSRQAEEKLKALLSDLVDLAKEDPAAAVIVKQYKIKQNAPAPEVKSQKPEARSQKPEARSPKSEGQKPAEKAVVKPAEKPVAPPTEKAEDK